MSGWHQQTEHCGGTDPSLSFCVVPMSIFQASPYNLAFDDLIQVRATAYNSYGYALAPSDINTAGARVRQVPDRMIAPVEVYSTDLEI